MSAVVEMMPPQAVGTTSLLVSQMATSTEDPNVFNITPQQYMYLQSGHTFVHSPTVFNVSPDQFERLMRGETLQPGEYEEIVSNVGSPVGGDFSPASSSVLGFGDLSSKGRAKKVSKKKSKKGCC